MNLAAAAIIRLIFALMFAQPFAPADVAAVGVSVTVVDETPVADAIGWTWCGGPVCRIEVVRGSDAWVLRHETCHSIDWLADGAMDGAIAGWRPWLTSQPLPGEPTDDAERFGYWCARQAVRGEVTA